MKFSKRLLCLVLALILVVPVVATLGTEQVEAAKKAKKPTLSHKKVVMPIGYSDGYWYGENDNDGLIKLSVKNKVKGATYTFKSSNTKVAKISSKGGRITGLKAGTATITVTQKLKGKSTKVGTCKVTVKEPTKTFSQSYKIGIGVEWDLYPYDYECKFRPTTFDYWYAEWDEAYDGILLGDYNFDSETFIFKATAEGTYPVKIYAAYKDGRKYKVGEVTLNAVQPGTQDYIVDDDSSTSVRGYNCIYDFMNSNDYTYKLISGFDVLSVYEFDGYDEEDYYDDDGNKIKEIDQNATYSGVEYRILKRGTAKVEVFDKNGTSIGISTIEVKNYYDYVDSYDDYDDE